MRPRTKISWQEDEIMRELREVRAKLSAEISKDPKAYYKSLEDLSKSLKSSKKNSKKKTLLSSGK